MIQSGTFIDIIDNSGAKKAFCIKILNSGYKQRYANVGNLILVSIKSVKFSENLKVKKGEIHKAVVIRTRQQSFNLSSNYKNFYHNAAVLINKQNKIIGTRVFGVIPKIIKHTKFLRLTSICSGLIF